MQLIGIDEVGRGCWAGPLLVVAATASSLPAVFDSKTINKARRETIYSQLIGVCRFGEGWVEAQEVDKHGLTKAMFLAVERALTNLGCDANTPIIMDGNVNYCSPSYRNVTCIVKADGLEPIVSAASIYAKVTRDRKMVALSKKYPGYGFDKHVGYGTKLHIESLRKLGVSDIHRKSYKPVRGFL